MTRARCHGSCLLVHFSLPRDQARIDRSRLGDYAGTRMAIFFTSDTHFGHGGALGLYRRPFASVAAMNEGLVERWNEVVRPDDVVWHLGDFAIRQRPQVVADLLARLNGRKHLLAGNNDPPATRELDRWESVQPYL